MRDGRCDMHEDCLRNADLAQRCWQDYLTSLRAIREGDYVFVLGAELRDVHSIIGPSGMRIAFREGARMLGRVTWVHVWDGDGGLYGGSSAYFHVWSLQHLARMTGWPEPGLSIAGSGDGHGWPATAQDRRRHHDLRRVDVSITL